MGFKALQKSDWVNLLIAIPAGIIAALVTIGFRLAIGGIDGLMFKDGSDITRAFNEYPLIVWPIITAVGGVVAGFILHWALRYESRNGKMPDYLDVIDKRLPGIPVVSTLLRSLSSLASIASGSSIGREGAMVQLSALSGSLLGRFTRFTSLHQSDVVAGWLRCITRRLPARCLSPRLPLVLPPYSGLSHCLFPPRLRC
jgi:CIC family chloride channel protein